MAWCDARKATPDGHCKVKWDELIQVQQAGRLTSFLFKTDLLWCHLIFWRTASYSRPLFFTKFATLWHKAVPRRTSDEEQL